MSGTNGNNSGNYNMALLEMLQANQKESSTEWKEAKQKQTIARRALLEAQQNSQSADAEVNETYQRYESAKTQVVTAINSMSR